MKPSSSNGSSSLSSSSPSASGEDNDEYIIVNLARIYPNVKCPICLGIIRKTRTAMECLHRFCKECIDKAMRMGKNACPACRTHFASRRSLRDDPRFDAIVAALFTDIHKYEEEEVFALDDENMIIAREFEETCAQIDQRQKGSRRATAPDVKHKRVRRATPLSSRHNSSSDNSDCGEKDDLLLVDRQGEGPSHRQVQAMQEVLSWGRGGMRTRMRSGSARPNHLNKLIACLEGSGVNDDEMDVYLTLTPLDEQAIPSWEQPNLCCKPTCSVRHLCKYVALQTGLESEQLELVFVEDPQDDSQASKLRILEARETLGKLRSSCSNGGNLVLSYHCKA